MKFDHKLAMQGTSVGGHRLRPAASGRWQLTGNHQVIGRLYARKREPVFVFADLFLAGAKSFFPAISIMNQPMGASTRSNPALKPVASVIRLIPGRRSNVLINPIYDWRLRLKIFLDSEGW